MKILGIQEMKGTSRKTGKSYDAVILYVGEEREGVVGVATGDVWVPRELWDNLGLQASNDSLLGAECYPSYDRHGFLQRVEIQ